MDLQTFADVFGLEYSAQPCELPPLQYFPNGILHIPQHKLPPMGGLPENLGALGAFYRHIRIGELEESDGFLPLLDGLFVWLEYEDLADAPEGWSIGVNPKTRELEPTAGWEKSWVIFAWLLDDSVLFADTANTDCPVFWMPTGYGDPANRVSVAPSLAQFMETLVALRALENTYRNSGRETEEDGILTEEWSRDARALVEKYLPEHAAGFLEALEVADG